mmetsp:Transcript_6146/g.8151  ORF Transcript_6146/g.8151 Transcript_6146/m.8151 type:complete len:281 (-) Transcript_6146:93-935(-)
MTSPVSPAVDDPWYIDMAGEVILNCSGSESKLFVGSLAAAESRKFIREKRITHILTVAASLHVTVPKGVSFQHMIVKCHDHPMASILEVLPSCFSFIDDAFKCKGNVLVHCASGVSRSVSVCTSFLLNRDKGLTLMEALKTVTSARKYANPNLGFRRQLQLLDNCNGDVDAAKKLYHDHMSNIVEDTVYQRNIVNDLHAKVDIVEASLASIQRKTNTLDVEDSIAARSRIELLKNELINLQIKLDSCLPESEVFVDPPAKIIRKAANAKIERLLVSIDRV